MILQALARYYHRLLKSKTEGLPSPGFGRQKVHFCLVLDKEGRLAGEGVEDLRSQEGKRSVPVERIVPEPVKRTSDVAANFLCDNTGYILGADGKGKPKRSAETFQVFKDLQRKIGGNADDDGMMAVLRFLEHWNPAKAPSLRYWEEMEGANLVFRLDGERRFIHESPTVRRLWLRYYVANGSDVAGMCLVSGRQSSIAQLHSSIKGVVGAQTSGASLVSFNLDASNSYEKIQNLNAPVGRKAAFAYTTALNWLLRDGSPQKVRIGETTVVFWAERKTFAESLLAGLLDPAVGAALSGEEDESPLTSLKAILDAARDGRLQDAVEEPDVPFFILGLSPNASRLSVRFWHVSTVGDIVGNIGKHFAQMDVVKNFDTEPDYPSVWRLLRETAAQGKGENISPLLTGSFMRSVLTGAPYPQNLLSAILLRIRADQTINKLRAGLIKACLVRNHQREVEKVLDKESTNVAYRLGRLFAVLEKAQKDAVNPSATIKDRYFGSASSTPRAVFPQLLRLAQHHIQKSEYGFAVEKRIEEVLQGVQEFPAHLSLEDQGMFALGYYHQRPELFKKASGDKSEGKEE